MRTEHVDENGMRLTEQDKEFAKLSNLRSQLVEARRQAQQEEDARRQLEKMNNFEQERITSHPMYPESISLVTGAVDDAIEKDSL